MPRDDNKKQDDNHQQQQSVFFAKFRTEVNISLDAINSLFSLPFQEYCHSMSPFFSPTVKTQTI